MTSGGFYYAENKVFPMLLLRKYCTYDAGCRRADVLLWKKNGNAVSKLCKCQCGTAQAGDFH